MMPPIDWEWACSQCPEVVDAHAKKDRDYEYGFNWYDFINTEQGLQTKLDKWWDSLTTERRHEILDKCISDCEEKLTSLKSARSRF